MNKKYVVIGFVVVLLLAGASFMAGRLLLQTAQANDGPQIMMGLDGEMMTSGGGPMIGGQNTGMQDAMMVEMEGAPELPQRAQDVMGTIEKIADNSIFVSALNGMETMIMIDENGNIETDSDAPESDANQVEIVITQDTEIYREVMEMLDITDPNAMEELPETIKQEVELITMEEIGDNGFITAWGQKRGERLIAEVVLYMGF